MLLPIYQKKEGNKIVLYSDIVNQCSVCNGLIKSSFVVFVDWVKPPNPEIYYSHGLCAQKVKKNIINPLAKLNQHFIVEFEEHLPRGCVPIILEVPEIKNAKIEAENLFSMALKDDGAKIKDKTKNSLKESWEGSSIGADVKNLLAEKEASIDENEVLKLIEQIQVESQKLIKQLEKDVTT